MIGAMEATALAQPTFASDREADVQALSPSTEDAVLVLADGLVLRGRACGARGVRIGEVVFNTGMTGYQEVLTDPSYAGQLVTFTYPEIGNTGVNPQDQEAARPHALGLIVRRLSPLASNWRSEEHLGRWLQRHGVVGIEAVDTRALVRHLREGGAINGAIASDGTDPAVLLERVRSAPSMAGLNLVDAVSTREAYRWTSLCAAEFDSRPGLQPTTPYRVAAIDFGIKRAILERLVAHGCDVTVLPARSSAEAVLALQPEGVFLSNGPGDPAAVSSGIVLTQALLAQPELPIFGICLGHQILGLALGGRSFKLGYGHRGLNHPCGSPGTVEITSQNHGFSCEADRLPSVCGRITHRNLIDHTVAAMELRDQPVFGVQYHPEAIPGTQDSDHNFGLFVALMAARRRAIQAQAS